MYPVMAVLLRRGELLLKIINPRPFFFARHRSLPFPEFGAVVIIGDP
jgi:hypothetical protein